MKKVYIHPSMELEVLTTSYLMQTENTSSPVSHEQQDNVMF